MAVTAGFGQYLENALLNWFRGQAFPAVPSNLYLALYTTPPVNGSLVGAVEVSGPGYARIPLVPGLALFTAPTGAAPAQIGLGANQVFPTPQGAWGTVTGWALLDNLGNLCAYGNFNSIQPASGDPVEFLSGQLTLSQQ